jgi:hypothetical protein
MRADWKFSREISNQTPLARRAGKLSFACGVCGVVFEKPAAWAKRTNNHYCSAACRIEGSKITVETQCVVCHATMLQTPSLAVRVVTCSKLCSSLRRRRGNTQGKSCAAYKKEARKLRSLVGKCTACGTGHGPFVVRGAIVDISGVPVVDMLGAEVWCRQCHMTDVSRLGVPARIAKHGR